MWLLIALGERKLGGGVSRSEELEGGGEGEDVVGWLREGGVDWEAKGRGKEMAGNGIASGRGRGRGISWGMRGGDLKDTGT